MSRKTWKIDPDMPLVDVDDLTVGYGHVRALSDVTLTLPARQLVAVVGPNGSGKSTLLKAIVGTLRPSSGSIRIYGHERAAVHQLVAYVPQRGDVERDFPITVREVVQMGRYAERGWMRRLREDDRTLIADAMERTGITHLAHRPIDALSGGQLQRTFVARAIAQDRPALLLDEPFAGIDAATEAVLLDLLEELRDEGRSIVVVHHDLEDVRARFDYCVLLDGRLLDAGAPAEVLAPDRVLATFTGHKHHPAGSIA
ncbi:MAG: transporter related protein [Thermoleophilia bacterium]|nr:transporter related protein [Thermoleophilia bacterium]